MARPRSRLNYRSRGTTAGLGLGGSVPSSLPPISGLSHLWRLEEATGTGDRIDSVGTSDMTVQGTGNITQAVGIKGYCASAPGGAGGPYLDSGSFSVPERFTISTFFKVPSLGDGFIDGSEVLFRASYNGSVYIYVTDPVTADQSLASTGLGVSLVNVWSLLIGRFNQSVPSFTLRAYAPGLTSIYNVSSVVSTGSGWVNSISTISLKPFLLGGTTTSASLIDEIMVFDRLLSDSECDELYAFFI